MLHLVPSITEIETQGLAGLSGFWKHMLHLVYSSNPFIRAAGFKGCHRKKTYSSFRPQCKLPCYSDCLSGA